MAGEFIGPLSTILGAGIGGAVGGPAGASVGGKIGSAVGGLGSLASGVLKKKKAESLMPPEQDAAQVSALEDAKRKLKQLESGTDANTQAAIQESEQLTAGTQGDILKATGGNIGGTVDALLKAQRIGGRNNNKALAGASKRASGFQGVVERMANRIEQRKLDIQSTKSRQAYAESAEAIQTGSQNAVAGALSAIPTGGMSKGIITNRRGDGINVPESATQGINQDRSVTSNVSSPGNILETTGMGQMDLLNLPEGPNFDTMTNS